ncbi:LuxR C-terminal-related transcriptional regulator [Streptomyces sp. NBC_01614]|uniref:helix-turn-helix transcriptional regulator n=1 Tax=Streptomyces sp. NBC_01614 TaxID=2975897 RepID=UPI00386C1EE4
MKSGSRNEDVSAAATTWTSVVTPVEGSVGRGLTSAAWGPGFVGRFTELAAIARCRDQVATGIPWLVAVEGEAGIGKTALVRQAVASGTDGLQVYWASCDQAEQDWPYGVLEQLLRRFPEDTPGLSDLADAITPTASPLMIGARLLALLAAASERAPIALVIDDLSCADQHSINALAFSLRRLFTESILILITTRSSDAFAPPPDHSVSPRSQDWQVLTRGTARVQRISLLGLTVDETAQLAASAGIDDLHAAAVRQLHRRTDGHPLHLRSLLSENSPDQLADVSQPLPVPTTLEAVVRHTIDALPHTARRLVEAVAVLDAPIPLAVAARLAEVPEPSSALDAALGSGLVEWQPSQPITPVRIHHPLQRDAIYAAITPVRRRALHTMAATLVSADDAWAHRAVAADVDSDLADQLAAEAHRLADTGRMHRAATFELWASGLVPRRDQYEQHLLAAANYLLLQDDDAGAQKLRKAIEGCAPSAGRDIVLGRLVAYAGEPVAAVEMLERARQTAVGEAMQIMAGTWLGLVRMMLSQASKATEALESVVNQLSAGLTRHRVVGLLSMAAGHTEGPLAGLDVIAKTHIPERAANVSLGDSHLLAWRGYMRVEAGQLQEGIDDLATLIARQGTHANLSVSPADYWQRGFAEYFLGRWDDALVAAEQTLIITEAQEQPLSYAPAHALAAIVHAQQGRVDQAAEHFEHSARHAASFPRLASTYKMVAQASMAQARADRPAMLDALRALQDPATIEPGNRLLHLLLWAPLFTEAVAHARDAQPSEVRLVRAAIRIFDRLAGRAPALTATSHLLHAHLAEILGQSEAMLSHYRAGVAVPADEGVHIPLHHAFLHHGLADRLLAMNDTRHHSEAALLLQSAHNNYARLGATPYIRRTAEELARLQPGARVNEAPTGLSSRILSEREYAVAHLAAEGLTNAEISRKLFISTKTVEYHLSHVYRKLHLTTRRELPSALTTDHH